MREKNYVIAHRLLPISLKPLEKGVKESDISENPTVEDVILAIRATFDPRRRMESP